MHKRRNLNVPQMVGEPCPAQRLAYALGIVLLLRLLDGRMGLQGH